MNRVFFVAIAMCTSLFAQEENYVKVQDECTLKILTPALAERQTAKIRLENGLEAFLISDPGVHQSCAALAVDAGSWEDPDEYPGMAHFLEHMLFMGTKAYPKESEYTTYISDHGGSRNAYTASDRTVYGFSINNDFFKEGLDRFSHFFIDPLFLQTSVGRELKNVDQEHGKNLEHDGWRAYMILKETGNPDHPNAKFSTGNAATLSGIPQAALKKWYENHYSASRMHLVMISPLPLDDLIELASEKFTPVINRTLKIDSCPNELLSAQQKGHWLYIKPVKDLKTLSMVWQLPETIALDQETHSTSLVSYVLSNGTQNGLCEELKREKLIEGLSVSADPFSQECLLMSIDFSLTDQGVKQLDVIVERTFQAVARLKETGIPRYIYDEQQKLALMNYEHQSRDDAFKVAMDIAGEMTQEKLETYPQKMILASRYDPVQITALVSALVPENCVFLVSADPKLTGVDPTNHEKWMNAAYAFKDISSDKLTAWSEASPHPHIDLPSPNPYFPDTLALVPLEDPAKTEPTPIIENDLGTVYFLQDQKYQVPETAVIFAIKTPEMNGSARSKVLFDLYLRSLSDKLSSPLFFAGQAGLRLSVSQVDNSFVISSDGYSEKTPLFLKTLFESLHEISPTSSEFEIFKQSLLSTYDNASKELPLKQGFQLLNSILVSTSPTSIARYEALQEISYEQFLTFGHDVFQKAYVEGTIYGNLTAIEALQIWNQYKEAVHPTPFLKVEHYKKAVFLPSDEQGPYMIVESTERQGNGTLLLIHEGAFSMEARATQQILSAALQDDFFDTLRTKQHTGYIATTWDAEIEEQLFQIFGVQSITHEPAELLARFDLFLEEFTRELQEKVPLERFNTLKQTLVKELDMPPENLPGKAALLHHLAFEKRGDFQWLQKRIQTVQSLSYDSFVKRADTDLSRQNHRRIAVLMEGVLPTQNQLRYEQISQEKIRDTGSYISAK
ncbi:MAG: insulinase family protein [Rhabdochlamydiaceae bacterium]|nr:insulinase family protein [Rhabdochlamydiaceae bacterium]